MKLCLSLREKKLATFKILFVIVSIFLWQREPDAKIYEFSLEEKIKSAELILFAEKINDKGSYQSSDELPFKQKNKNISPRYTIFSVKTVLKGEYPHKTITLDYKKTNEKYHPFICRPRVTSPLKKDAILFLEKDNIVFAGFQGQIALDSDSANPYTNALEKIIAVVLKDESNKVHELIAASNSDDKYLKNLAKQIIIGTWDNINESRYIPVMIGVLKYPKNNNAFKNTAISMLGRMKAKEAFDLIKDCMLQDKDKISRKLCVESLVLIDGQKAIPWLEKYLEIETWEPGKKAAKFNLEKLKKPAKKI